MGSKIKYIGGLPSHAYFKVVRSLQRASDAKKHKFKCISDCETSRFIPIEYSY